MPGSDSSSRVRDVPSGKFATGLALTPEIILSLALAAISGSACSAISAR